MTARRVAAVLLLTAAAGLLWIAVLTPLRSAEIDALDAEAERIGREWAQDQGNEDLVHASNEAYDAARALEPPLGPLTALGAALLFGAAGAAVWPGRRDAAADADAADGRPVPPTER